VLNNSDKSHRLCASDIGKFALGQNPLLEKDMRKRITYEYDAIRLHDLCFIFAHSDFGYIKQFTQLPANQLHRM
jgi:hypothetical protein